MVREDVLVAEGLALLRAVETAKETGEPVEHAGVTIYPDSRQEGDPIRPFDTTDLPRKTGLAGVVPVEGQAERERLAYDQQWDDDRRGVKAPYAAPGLFEKYPAMKQWQTKKVRLYTAGCISGDDRPFEEKAAVFHEGAAALRDKGFEVVNPLDVGNDRCFHGPETCHQETLRRLKGKDQGAGHSWECYLRHDLIEALQCDGIALLPGWEQSPGARMECDVATRVGIPAKPIEEWLDSRKTFVGVDPGTDTVITGYLKDNMVHVLHIDEHISVDANGHAYCARCKIEPGNHLPGGSRFGCAYAGPGTEDKCSQCGQRIFWTGTSWVEGDFHGGQNAVCRDSTQPDVAHEPAGIGEQR